ncbi:MAG: cytidylate kinase family protein [Anaerolineae bacterium]
MRARIITITGEVATGKTAIVSALLEFLPSWRAIHIGQKFRDYAEARGLTVQNISELPDEIHLEFDGNVKRELETGENIICEGRMAGILAQGIPDSIKVLCFAPLEVRMKRYAERENVTLEKAEEEILYRDKRDSEKLRRIYGITNYLHPQFYDLKIDTSIYKPKDIARLILSSANLLSQQEEL